jgi:cathepsin F
MKIVAVLASILALSCAKTSDRFGDFVARFSKPYQEGSPEFLYRQSVYERNLEFIELLNARSSASVVYSIETPFADMSPEEFKSRVLMFPRRVSPVPLKESSNISIPESWDWRDKGAVSPVRDQGSLGTCWAFSTAQNIEGQRFLKFGVLEQLSVEQLIECDASADVSRGWADCGMFGGWPYLGFQYLMKAGGIFSEKDYPYCAGEGKCLPCMPRNYDLKLCGDHSDLFCKANNTQGQKLEGLCNPKSGFAVSIRDWTRFSQDEREIADALVRTGPLSVLVNADSLQYYSGGIVDADSCDPTELDHAVLLVGYGSEDGQDYWVCLFSRIALILYRLSKTPGALLGESKDTFALLVDLVHVVSIKKWSPRLSRIPRLKCEN